MPLLVAVTVSAVGLLGYGVINLDSDVVCVTTPCPTDTTDAWVALAMGAVMLVVAIGLWLRRGMSPRR